MHAACIRHACSASSARGVVALRACAIHKGVAQAMMLLLPRGGGCVVFDAIIITRYTGFKHAAARAEVVVRPSFINNRTTNVITVVGSKRHSGGFCWQSFRAMARALAPKVVRMLINIDDFRFLFSARQAKPYAVFFLPLFAAFRRWRDGSSHPPRYFPSPSFLPPLFGSFFAATP